MASQYTMPVNKTKAFMIADVSYTGGKDNDGIDHSYYYDHDAKLNVVMDEKGVTMPFVDSKLDQLCISTKTRAQMESDDEGSFIYK